MRLLLDRLGRMAVAGLMAWPVVVCLVVRDAINAALNILRRGWLRAPGAMAFLSRLARTQATACG